jgi:hypothetical protein
VSPFNKQSWAVLSVQATILCRVMQLLAVHQYLSETESGHLLAVSVLWSEWRIVWLSPSRLYVTCG